MRSKAKGFTALTIRSTVRAFTGIKLGYEYMKLTQRVSGTTVIESDVSSTPPPLAPCAQCRTLEPVKCPPVRISVSPGATSCVSPLQYWTAGSGRIT